MPEKRGKKKEAVFLSLAELDARHKPIDTEIVLRSIDDGLEDLRQNIESAEILFPIYGAIDEYARVII